MNVILREWRKTDIRPLAKIANNKKIWDNLRDRMPLPYTKKDAKEWISLVKRQKIVTTFCVEVNGEVAGSVGFTLKEDVYRKNIEVGYFIAEEYWGKGVATEAVRQLIEYIEKNFDVVRIYAEVFEHNKASMKVMQKNGFYLECIRKKSVIKNGTIMDDYVLVKLVQ